MLVAAVAWPAADPARAQQTPPAATPLAEIVNAATRTDRRSDEVPATVTVKTAAEVEARGARDLKDLFRHEVDLSIRAATPRFGAALGTSGRAGNEGINIRGLEGNQVLLLVDGIRLPGSFTFGAFATGRLDTLAVDSMQSAEVLRGPASTQFGSDGLAGALVLRTAEASDLLKPGQDRAGFVRFGTATDDKSLLATVANAWRGNGWDTLLMASVRSGHEVDTQGENDAPDARRSTPNPVDYRQTSVLAKFGLVPDATQRFGLTLETVQRRVDTDVISARTAPPTPPAVLPGTAVLDLDARDRSERHRVSLQHRYDDLNAALVQKLDTQLYAQDAKMRQFSAEDRNTAADRTRDNRYREQLLGAGTQAEANFSTPWAQRVSGGLEWSRNRITAVRDGTVAPAGETFPSKPFPDTRYTLLGAHLQDEIQVGAVSWIPALRWDHYRLVPGADAYAGEAVALSGEAFTPRLGVVWKALPELSLYGQASRGFRAPTPDQVNNGFTNVASGYRSIGNPSLKPEHARSIELGLRGRIGSALSWQVAGYDNRYADFISQQQVSGSFTPADPAVFQFVNLAAARIRGAEARATWRPAPGWQLQAAAARAVGDSEQGGVSSPLLSIEPSKLALGARWESGVWSARADMLHTRAKPSGRIAQPAPPAAPLFAPGASTTLDLGVGWKATQNVTLHAAVDNVTDSKYWRWSDVRGVAGNSAVLDAFTAPGRSATLSARFDF